MKKFITKIVLLFASVALFDFAFGMVMDHIVNKIEIGGQGRDNYICNKSDEDIMIFGSSRAIHHYNSPMIEDSLGMTCFNCGEEGNGIILSYSRLKMIKERKTPKVIIEDVECYYDLMKNDNHKYLGWIKTRYNREGIKEVFDSIDSTEKYKMNSEMYRYNSKFLQNIFVYLTSISATTDNKGFAPYNSTFKSMKIDMRNEKKYRYKWDYTKLHFLNKFIDLSSGSKLYFIVSPSWYKIDPNQFTPIREICKQRNISFIDFTNDPKYCHNDKYFMDGVHLNAVGADEFTREIIEILKKDGVINN